MGALYWIISSENQLFGPIFMLIFIFLRRGMKALSMDDTLPHQIEGGMCSSGLVVGQVVRVFFLLWSMRMPSVHKIKPQLFEALHLISKDHWNNEN